MNRKPFKIEFCRDLLNCKKHDIPGYFCNYAHTIQELRPKYCRNGDECSDENCEYYHRNHHQHWVKQKTAEWQRLCDNHAKFEQEENSVHLNDLVLKKKQIVSSSLRHKDDKLILLLQLEVVIKEKDTIEEKKIPTEDFQRAIQMPSSNRSAFSVPIKKETSDEKKTNVDTKTDNHWEQGGPWLTQTRKRKNKKSH